jgi:hypothetical protein
MFPKFISLRFQGREYASLNCFFVFLFIPCFYSPMDFAGADIPVPAGVGQNRGGE